MAHVYFPNHSANAPQHAMTHASRRLLQDEQRARKAAAQMQKPCEIILVRHGETAWNKEGRLQGQQEPGPPLDDLGLQQAAVAADVLQQCYPSVDAVFSSDLLRAVQTAEVVAAAYKLQVCQHRGLRERHMGVLQGFTYTEAPHAQPEAWAALQSDDTRTRVPGGESLDELRERLTAAVLDVAHNHPGGRVVVISHGGALHALHRAARGYQAKGKVFNCSISVLLAEADATRSSSSSQHSRQQQQQQQSEVQVDSNTPTAAGDASAAAGGGSQQPHLNPDDPADLSVKVVAADADEIDVVWCDFAELCQHCSSSSGDGRASSDGHEGHTDAAGTTAAADGSHTAVSSTQDSAGPPASPAAASSAAGAASKATQGRRKGSMQRCGGGRVQGGRLALLSWNDSYALQAAHLQSDKAFGGSSRAG